MCWSVPVLLERVGKTYGRVRALTDVSARFEGGTTNVVEGPNGSGKSTLLAIVATLVKPTFGKVDHGELGPSAAEVRSRLGWVGHDSLCYPDLSGRENIELAARLCGEDPKSSYLRAAERFKLGLRRPCVSDLLARAAAARQPRALPGACPRPAAAR